MPATQFGEEGLAGGWAYSKEEEQLGEESVGADFAAAGHSHRPPPNEGAAEAAAAAAAGVAADAAEVAAAQVAAA